MVVLPTASESPLVYACELRVFAMCPALRGSTVSYAGDAHLPKHSLEYSLNFWSQSKKKEPLGLNRDNLRRMRKRKGAPKWVPKMSKMVETMAKNNTEEVPMGVFAHEIWDAIVELDKDGRRLLKDEAKNKKQREREKRKKAKAKPKKRAKKEQKRRK